MPRGHLLDHSFNIFFAVRHLSTPNNYFDKIKFLCYFSAMKLKLGIFLLGLVILAFSVGALVESLTKTPMYNSPSAKDLNIPSSYKSTGAGAAAGWAVFGAGVAASSFIFLRDRK